MSAHEEPIQTEAEEARADEETHEAGPPPLDPQTRARRDAALEHVRQYGDPVLRSKATPVADFD